MCSRLRYGVCPRAVNGDVCVCVSFFRLHRGEEGRVAASHGPELAGQDRHQEHEDALFAYAETNQRLPAVGRGRGWWRAHASATVSGDAIQKASARLAAHGFFRVVSIDSIYGPPAMCCLPILGDVHRNPASPRKSTRQPFGHTAPHLTQRGRGEHLFWIHTQSPPPDFGLSD